MKSSSKLVEEIDYLLRNSNWWGNGPHGRTISAVMKRVKILRKRVYKPVMKIVRTGTR